MKLRYTLLIGSLALVDAYSFHSSIDIRFIIIGCCVLFALRCIEHQLEDLKGRLHSPDESDPAEDCIRLRNGDSIRFVDAFHPYRTCLVREISEHGVTTVARLVR